MQLKSKKQECLKLCLMVICLCYVIFHWQHIFSTVLQRYFLNAAFLWLCFAVVVFLEMLKCSKKARICVLRIEVT